MKTKTKKKSSYLGPIFSDEEISKRLEGISAQFEVLEEDEFIRSYVEILQEGKAVGWVRGEPIVCTPEDALWEPGLKRLP